MGAGFESGLTGVAALVAPPPKITPIEYNKYLTDTISGQALGLKDLRGIGNTAADAYAANVAASTPQYNALNQDTINRLGKLADQYGGADQLANYERLRTGDLGAATGFLSTAGNWLTRANKASLAPGYGGRGPSTYLDALQTNNLTSAGIPLIQSIFNNLGPNTALLNQGQLADLAATTGLLQSRLALPGAGDARALLPYQARLAMLGSEIPLSGQIAAAAKANVAGYRQDNNKWATFLQDLGRSMDQGYDAYMSMGAGGGGGMGGLGGIGGGGASSGPPQPATTVSWTGGGGGVGGLGAGAGNVNTAQLAQLAQAYMRAYGGGGGLAGGGGIGTGYNVAAPSSNFDTSVAPEAGAGWTFGLN